jgi:hypothetical protein
MTTMTIKAFIERLSQYPDDDLCCGTFWLKDDFLSINEKLTDDEIEMAMEIATSSHDANIGFNWDHITYAISEIKE